ncbi:MAG: hypothetical protein U0575_06275 [Phycisphaerales bacterium]|jgi:hypothetical protein
MPRHVDNAFVRSPFTSDNRSGLHPMRATLTVASPREIEAFEMAGAATGWRTLVLSPVRLPDVLPGWCSVGAIDDARTVALEASFREVAGRPAPRALADAVRSLGAEPEQLAHEPHEAIAEAVADDCAVLGDKALALLARRMPLSRVTLVRVLGAVEARDAMAIREAIGAGRHPALADFRVAHVLRVVDDRTLRYDTTSEDYAMLTVADNLRNYVAAVLDRDVDTIGWPMPSQVQRLLAVSGRLVVRPVETDTFQTFVDVGVCTSRDENSPARQSLIYDLPSRSWHDER